ncbi:phosphoglycerate dehydrogenase [Anoxybacterium hadale]|uniref:Phosphoglycerate dehydrogenase n=1 Tax=Anoxybacterium hadale TaxID=3408580 RepID=A0ACD1AG40_9FIRM|nr:phosphoglycerate dehydrogenase [Clostridiales bacterium]
MKILVTPTSLQPGKGSKALETLKAFSEDLIFNTTGKPLSEDELIPLLADCDGYIAGLDFVTENVLKSCTRLKVVSRYGAGYDRVDIAAAKSLNIPVTNTPGVNAEAVGELAFGLALSVARKIPYLHTNLCGGGWIRSTGIELKGKTIGIMGLGAIGKVVARCAKGFDMEVIAYDPYINAAYCEENGITSASFDEVIMQADVISLHLPLMASTHHMISASAIAKMRPTAILVNTSRGGLIDEDAAYDALKAGRLGGLALDAFEIEPPTESPLFSLYEVVATPHTGAHTAEAMENMAVLSVQNLIDVLESKPCPFIVNQ